VFQKGRVRTPTVIQMEAVECGAAALGSILAYYGRWVPLEKLRVQCDVGRDGSKAPNLMAVAKEYGLETHAYRKKVESLWEMALPVIVFWNFNHFVVVEGRHKDQVYLNDPATGPRTVSMEEFESSYTGAVLTFKPTPEFEKGGHRKSLYRSLRPRLRGSESGLFYIILASFGLVVPGLMIPGFIKVFVDEILGKHQHDWTLWLLLVMLGTSLLTGVLHWLQKYILLRLHTRIASTSSAQFLWHVLRLPMEFYSQRYAGEIGSRVHLNDKVAALLSGKLATAAVSVLTIVCYAAVMFFYDVLLTWIAIAMACINVLALTFVSRIRTDANAQLLQHEGRLTGTTMGGLQLIETLKSTGRESDFFARWAGYQAKVVNVQQQLGRSSQALSALPPLVTSVANLLILCVGGLRVIEGQMTVGMVIAFQSLLGQFLGPVNQLVGLGGELQEMVGDLNRLDDVLFNEVQAEPELEASEEESEVLSGHLELRDITFGYNRHSPPLIDGFSLKVEPGQRVALVGTTGSGKSTLAKLVCGLYQPWSGEVLFDGRPRDQISPTVLTGSIGHVDQDVVLFGGTVRENLTLWDETVPHAEVVQATKDAHIYETIAGRAGALDGMMDEGGQNFSGGEQQRLEIARALVGKPTILVMDEATSALDPLVEKAIDENLRARGCTCLIIAHRLSTIRDADEIIVLHQGKVVQRGRHQELVASDGPYRRLIQAEPGVLGEGS